MPSSLRPGGLCFSHANAERLEGGRRVSGVQGHGSVDFCLAPGGRDSWGPGKLARSSQIPGGAFFQVEAGGDGEVEARDHGCCGGGRCVPLRPGRSRFAQNQHGQSCLCFFARAEKAAGESRARVHPSGFSAGGAPRAGELCSHPGKRGARGACLCLRVANYGRFPFRGRRARP